MAIDQPGQQRLAATIIDLRLGKSGQNLIGVADKQDNYPDTLNTEVLVASIRSPQHVFEAARLGADVCTIPPPVIHQLARHPLTDKGLDAFLADWKSTGQSIVKDGG